MKEFATIPGRRAMLAAACLALAMLGAIVYPRLALAAFACDALVIALCFLEGWKLSKDNLKVEREPCGRVQVDRPQEFAYRLTNRSRTALIVHLRQPWPAEIEAEGDEAEVRVEPGQIARIALTATPKVRGTVEIPAARMDVRTPIDWARRRGIACPKAELRVFPTLRLVNEYEALRRHHCATIGGLHRRRLLGAGREYEQLRDYLPDDDYRDINWKATARRNQPITTLYEAQRSQDVMLCIDCGRMMGNPVGDGTALDYAVDAAIMLAHVANREGDRIGLALFRDVVYRLVKPKAGIMAVHRIVEELAEARPRGVFPSFAALAAALRAGHNRRSMIFLFTDLNDPQLASNLVEVMPLLSRRHVLIIVSLRDPLLERVAGGPAGDKRAVFEVLAARQLTRERDTCIRELTKIGAHVLEADAGSLTLKLINHFLSVKARQLV
jgi:uncharacterized protein (DUF58 family)